MPPHLISLLSPLWALPPPQLPPPTSIASAPAASSIKREETNLLGHNVPFYALHERKLPPRNDSQPHQNLGGPQTTTCYFAMQFEMFPERMKKLLKEEGWKKRDKEVFL